MPPENWFGLIGSALLLVPPLRDQVLRFLAARSGWRAAREDRAGRAVFADLQRIVRDGYGAQMSRWNGWDSLSMAAGALCLMASYLVGA